MSATAPSGKKSQEAPVSNIRITEFEGPKSAFHITVLGLVILAFTVFTTKNKIVPGTFVYDNLLPFFPGGPKWFLGIADNIAVPVLLIHILEATLLDRLRLHRYGVERFSGLWWAWIVDCFFEGYGCFVRIDAQIARKTAEAKEAKN